MLKMLKDAVPEPTCGIFVVVLLSCSLFAIKTYFSLTHVHFTAGASIFEIGHVHKLFTYPLYHDTFAQLLLNIGLMVLLCGSFEKNVGTVRFLFLFQVLSTCTGFWYAFLDLLQIDDSQTPAEGLVPITLTLVAVTTMHTRVAKGYLLGVSLPTMALPWLFLIIVTIAIPHTVLPCNMIAILTGWVYGKGWISFLDISEARACVLEKMVPFKILRCVKFVQYIPASTEERRKTILPQIKPTPGSYPVQAYAPSSSINSNENTATMYEGWPNSTDATLSVPIPSYNLDAYRDLNFGPSPGYVPEHSFGHTCQHSHSHGQQ